jgi:hypothetical protein
MNASDKQSLPWWPEEAGSGSAKGKEKVGLSDLVTDSPHNGGQPKDDVRIPINSASSSFSDDETVSRDELAKILTPEPLPVHDDRVRRSSLWDSAVALDIGSKAFSDDSETRRKEIREETRAGKRVAETDGPQSATTSDVEAQGRPQPEPAQMKEIDVFVHSLEIEKPTNRVRSEMKAWVQRSDEKRNSLAERLSYILKPRAAAGAEAEAIPLQKKRVSNVSKEKQVSQLNQSPLHRKQSTLAERMPPEWVLLLLGCVIGLSSGLSVVAFNRLVCLHTSDLHTSNIHEFPSASSISE